MMSDKLPIFKDGECPYCHYDTHAIGNEPLRCELCGWIDMKPKTHEIKILERPYIAAHIGIKPWEYRKDDRCYNVGDILCLYLWNKGIAIMKGSVLNSGLHISCAALRLASQKAIAS